MKELKRNSKAKRNGSKGKTKYKYIIFVPATPDSTLQKEYSRIIKKHNIEIKVIEWAWKQILKASYRNLKI